MTPSYIIRRMDEPTTENKVLKAWRLHPDIAKAIEGKWESHRYPSETAYVEAIFRQVFGLPDPPTKKPQRPRIGKKAMALGG